MSAGRKSSGVPQFTSFFYYYFLCVYSDADWKVWAVAVQESRNPSGLHAVAFITAVDTWVRARFADTRLRSASTPVGNLK